MVFIEADQKDSIQEKIAKLSALNHQVSPEKDKPYETISFSFGYSKFENGDTSFSDIFSRAERLMYQNKANIHLRAKELTRV